MKILIYTATCGNGHNSTAKNIKDLFPNDEVKVVDVYRAYQTKFKKWIFEDVSIMLIENFVGLYNWGFKTDERATQEQANNKVKVYINEMLKKMLEEIYIYKPDVIVSTYVFASAALSKLREDYYIPAKIFTTVLDYNLSPFWECTTNIDYIFTTGEYLTSGLIEKGFNKNQIIPTGIPIHSKFYKNLDKKETIKKLNLDEKLFTILVMKASYFPLSSSQILKEIKKIDKPCQIIIVNGKNKKVVEGLDKKIEKLESPHKIINLGFIDNIEEYLTVADLVIMKAGGLTVSEVIAKQVPAIIVNNLPQQEIYNKDYLVNNYCALEVDSKNKVHDLVNFLIENEDQYLKLKQNMKKLYKPNALIKIEKYIKSCPRADYSKIEYKCKIKNKTLKKNNPERYSELKKIIFEQIKLSKNISTKKVKSNRYSEIKKLVYKQLKENKKAKNKKDKIS